MKNAWGTKLWKKERDELDKKLYAELDTRTPERTMTRAETKRLLCRDCMHYAMPQIGGYGFSRPDPWVLMCCNCKYKYCWVLVKD